MAKRSDLLLDTCAAIWMTQGAHLESDALAAIDRSGEEGRPIRLSLITAWELGLLAKSGRAAMTQSPSAIFRAFLQLPGIVQQDLTADILIDSSLLPTPIHGDPADRIIIATARALDLTIVTRDRLILDYAAHGHVRALAC
jgi:PIN domain nuclease of toxin-antitoxin system